VSYPAFGEGEFREVSEFIRHIIVSNVDQSTNFAAQSVLNRHFLTAPVAPARHCKWFEIELKPKVVPKFLRRKFGPMKPAGYAGQPNA
jgi:hypothetical protein